MKIKKWISLLLAVCLMLSLLPALSLNAAAVETETLYFCSFESEEEMKNWLFFDNDGDGYNWMRYGDGAGEKTGATDGNCALISLDYISNGDGALTPDNWAYSPAIKIPAVGASWLSYDVFAQDPEYCAEHYSVYAYVEGKGVTELFTETLKEGEDRDTPAHRNIALDDFAGQTIQLAFRHHDVTDEYAIGIDSVKVEHIVPRNISEVSVFVQEPTVGKSISNIGETKEENADYTVANVQWEPNDTEFKANTAYTVLVTLEAKEDCVFTAATVPYINGNSAQIVSQSEQEMKISYSYSALLPVMPSMYFDDVKTTDWFYNDVEFAYYYGLMGGIGNNKFDPKGQCTRGMIVTILYRMEGSPDVSGACTFTDVKAGRYYETPIIWAAANGIVDGVGNGKFAPEASITREQLATILCRYAKFKGVYNEADCVTLVGFKDCDKTSGWAQEAMSWAVGTGLITGSNESTGLYLLPRGNALRCQVAAIFHRYCDNFVS